MFSNPLMFNTPLHIKIEIDRNKKCKEIIEVLKNMEELHLDNDELFTEFINVLSSSKAYIQYYSSNVDISFCI